MSAELDRLRAEQSNAGNASDALYQENTRLTLLADELKEKQTQAEARAAGLETRLDAIKEELKKEAADARQRLAEMQQEKAALNDQLQDALAQREGLAELERQHATLNDSHARLEARAEAFAAEAAQLRPHTAELESQVERLRLRSSD